jgi:hypothetical protein
MGQALAATPKRPSATKPWKKHVGFVRLQALGAVWLSLLDNVDAMIHTRAPESPMSECLIPTRCLSLRRACGTYLACLVLGVPVEEGLVRANAAGALAVLRRGPIEGNSSKSDLDSFIAGRSASLPAMLVRERVS